MRALPPSLRGGARAKAVALDVGLVNNMPDSALKATERQFGELLDAAAAGLGLRVRLHLFTLPEIARSPRAREHCEGRYGGLDELCASGLDALIVTGAEPRTARLCEEPYWDSLAALFDWAARNTVSTLLSCLAAHAAVLHFDGIERRRLATKRLGVFAHAATGSHPLTAGADLPWRVAHSRWNEIPESALAGAGYSVLTRSAEAGPDLFIKQRGSLFVHCQGHPEYAPDALLREYQRDIRRFLTGEQDSEPVLPRGYFNECRSDLPAQLGALAGGPAADHAVAHGLDLLEPRLRQDWSAPARCLYRNWLDLVSTRAAERAAGLAPVAAAPREAVAAA